MPLTMKSHGTMPWRPIVASLLAAVLFFTPFFCLFLPIDIATERELAHPSLLYTTYIGWAAFVFYCIPMLICGVVGLTEFYWICLGAFLQSLLLTTAALWYIRLQWNKTSFHDPTCISNKP